MILVKYDDEAVAWRCEHCNETSPLNVTNHVALLQSAVAHHRKCRPDVQLRITTEQGESDANSSKPPEIRR